MSVGTPTEAVGGGQRDRLSIRRLSVVFAVALGVLSVALAATLVWSTSALEDALETVNRDARSLAITDDLNLSLLTYQRLSNLLVSTGEPGLNTVRAEIAMEMDQLLEEAVAHASGASEIALLSAIDEELSDFLAERLRLEGQGPRLEEVVAATRAPLEGLLARMEDLRALNEGQVEQANLTAMRVMRFAEVAGIAYVVLLLSAMGAVVWGVRQLVARPIAELQATVERLRQGDSDARAPAIGPSEFAELGRTFNEMADALGHVREGQLAFIAGVAHDLRNPLSSLKMGLHALGRMQSAEQHRRALELLDQQVDQFTRMVNDLLDATQIEAGRLELRPEDMDLREAAESAVTLYAPTTRRHQLVLEPSAAPATIRADPVRIQQVIGNLLSNAIKFSPQGGPVVVRVESDGDREEVAVSVSDRGVGLNSAEIDNLFLPFRRHRPEVAPGAGLGLSVVQRIVEAHRGRIDVVSEPGAGTTFRISFPRVPPQ